MSEKHSVGWFRFGLPFGSALVSVGLLEIIAVITTLPTSINVFRILLLNILNGLVIDQYYAVTACCAILRIILCLILWMYGIFKGKTNILIFWMCISVPTEILSAVGQLMFFLSPSNAEFHWNFVTELGVQFLCKYYFYSVVVQCIHNFDWVGKENISVFQNSEMYTSLLEPIAEGFSTTVKFYNTRPKLTVNVLVIVEMVWSVDRLLSFFGKNVLPQEELESLGYHLVAYKVEQGIFGPAKIILCVIALIFLRKGKVDAQTMKLWTISHFTLSMISLSLYSFIAGGVYSKKNFISDYGLNDCYLPYLFGMQTLLGFGILHYCLKYNNCITQT